MLRRDFIRAAALALGGLVVATRIGFAEDNSGSKETSRKNEGRRTYHFHGHPRSGCASPPELAPLLEKGISNMPPV
jgi:hypothetical protein